MTDINAIKARHEKAHDSVHSAHGDRGVLIAEVERLRDEADLLRTAREATRAYADRVEAEVVALRGERAAVVAWLRAESRVAGVSPDERRMLAYASSHIERGEHRREED
jgi:hypothetical protein